MCDCQNVSIKLPFVCVCLSPGDLFIFSVRVSSFFSYFLCYPYFGTFLSTWSLISEEVTCKHCQNHFHSVFMNAFSWLLWGWNVFRSSLSNISTFFLETFSLLIGKSCPYMYSYFRDNCTFVSSFSTWHYLLMLDITYLYKNQLNVLHDLLFHRIMVCCFLMNWTSSWCSGYLAPSRTQSSGPCWSSAWQSTGQSALSWHWWRWWSQ